jgi:AraC-like DNA-binding protein
LYALDTSRAGALVSKAIFHVWVLQGLAYLVLAVERVRRARSLLEQASADDAVLRLHWLHRFAALNGLIWGLLLVDRICEVTGIHEGLWQSAALGVMTTSALFALAWFGLRLPLVASAEEIGALPSGRAIRGKSSYARSGLDGEQCIKIAADLSRLLEQENLYADSQLDLHTLSRRSGWSSNYISQALNQGLNQSFFEFVNGYRVSAAERCLIDPADERTILEVALACGFGSKSTFNAVFKRMTGRTPGELRRARTDAPDASTA